MMRAAVIAERGLPPVLQDFPEPQAREGATLIKVDTGRLGCSGVYRLGVQFPCVIRGEGVGHAPGGRRVYFGERSVAPFEDWAERTLVPTEEVWDVPDDVDDALAITMGIAGTGALLPLEQARIQPGETVLMLGVRERSGSSPCSSRAFWVVALGGTDDAVALKAVTGEGFDVVLDGVCGAPMLAALKATRWGARGLARSEARYRRPAVPLAQLCRYGAALGQRSRGHLAQAPADGARASHHL